MEFGIFSQMHCPPWDERALALPARARGRRRRCDAVGFKYDWSPEHHFLEHYSHQPAPEVFLSWVAARTKRIHVGTAITNITAAVNHPARVAERIATSTTSPRGASSSAPAAARRGRVGRLRHPVGGRDQADVARVAGADPAHVARRAVLVRGQVLPDAQAQRAAEAVLEAAPAHVGRVLEPADVHRGRRARPRRAVLHVRHAERDRRRSSRATRTPSSAARSRSAATSTTTSPSPPTCSACTTATRRGTSTPAPGSATSRGYFFKWLDSIPRPKGLPTDRPDPAAARSDARRAEGRAGRRRAAGRLAGRDRQGHPDVRGDRASIS